MNALQPNLNILNNIFFNIFISIPIKVSFLQSISTPIKLFFLHERHQWRCKLQESQPHDSLFFSSHFRSACCRKCRQFSWVSSVAHQTSLGSARLLYACGISLKLLISLKLWKNSEIKIRSNWNKMRQWKVEQSKLKCLWIVCHLQWFSLWFWQFSNWQILHMLK